MSKETISQTEGLCKEVANCIRNAYDRGYKQGVNDGSLDVKMRVDGAYEKGLNDAWECVRKIIVLDEPMYVVGGTGLRNFICNHSPSEAIQKIKEYEEKQKADSNKVTRQSIIKSQLMDIVNGQKNPVTADEIVEVLKQLKGEGQT